MPPLFIRNFFTQAIYSTLDEDLQQNKRLYHEKNTEVYLQKMEIFYADYLKHSPHSPLLFKLQQSLSSGNADAVYQLSDEISRELNNLYKTAEPTKNINKRTRFSWAAAGIISFVLLVAFAFAPLKERYIYEKAEYDLVANEEAYKAKTIADILALKEALQKYYTDHQAYPKSSDAYDAIISENGQSKTDWIPGLAPKYIAALPLDPRKTKDPRKQYMYKSDGKDYKLIAHNPLGIDEAVKNYPDLVDPTRPSWAFGVWSDSAKNW